MGRLTKGTIWVIVLATIAAVAGAAAAVMTFMSLGSEGSEYSVCDEDGLLLQPQGPAARSVAPAADTGGPPGTEYETLNGEQLQNATTIINVGVDAGVSEFGLVVAIATAMQESKLVNVDYGDRDSLGLFQQRPSTGWGTPEQVQDPVFASRAFFGGPGSPHWLAPTNRAEPPGLLDIVGWESMTVAEAAQAVQRSAFPDAYAQWEQMARITVAGVTGGDIDDIVLCGPGEAMTCPATNLDAEAGLTPDALRVLRCLAQEYTYPDIAGFAGVGDRPANPDSDHPAGRAVDVLFIQGGAMNRPKGNEIAQWVVDHASALGVKYVIWYERIWSAERSDEGWRPYEHPSGADDDTSAHRDHIHVSVYGNSAGTGVGSWVNPVQGTYTITARFGSCGDLWQACHTGIDLASPAARPIVAAAAGQVTTFADLGGTSYGRYITVTHPDGTETWYAHLEAYAPSLGVDDQVAAGQLLGYMGATGNVTGRHLHFEVRPAGGAPTDPAPWMADHGVEL